MLLKGRSLKTTFAKPVTMYGVEIKKLPFGKYAQALQGIEDIVETIGAKAFPGRTADEILGMLKNFDLPMLWKVIAASPEAVAGLLESLLDIPRERILDPDCEDGLSPKELTDIVTAAWKINDLSGFLKGARVMIAEMRAR